MPRFQRHTTMNDCALSGTSVNFTLERGDRRRCDRATGKQQMHPIVALFAPDGAIERRER